MIYRKYIPFKIGDKMLVFKIITVLSVIISIIFQMKFFMHMFQLNSYNERTQLGWYKKNAVRNIPNVISIAMGISLCIVLQGNDKLVKASLVIFAVFMIVFIAIYHESKARTKKKLVYTMRVKRMYITDFIIILAAIIVGFCMELPIGLLIYGIIYGCIPFIIILGNIINKPIEKAVNNHYIKEARAILKSHPSLKIIGITGSFGKTSVKYYLNTLLKAKYNVLMTPESYNTPMGVVKTIRGSLKPIHEIFICEMGAKKVGEIKEICDIVDPQDGIITSIGPQHLETFKSLDNVKKTKFELAEALPEAGLLLVNGNDENIKAYNYKKPYITYGVTEDCDYFAYDIQVSSKGTAFKVKIKDEECTFKTNLIGRHNVINIVGTIAMAHLMGISLVELKPQVRKLESVPHRLQLIGKNGITIIDDAFNSNPTGAKAALDTLNLFDGTKILITPGMVELGQKEEELNKELGRQAAEVCDYIFLVGINRTKPIYDGIVEKGFDKAKVIAYDTLGEALETMYSLNEPNKYVLLENDLPDNY